MRYAGRRVTSGAVSRRGRTSDVRCSALWYDSRLAASNANAIGKILALSASIAKGVLRMKKALISGITGQDGSYLAEFLLAQGYEVHGIIRRSSSLNTGRIQHIFGNEHDSSLPLTLHFGDLTDSMGLVSLMKRIKPDEVYNLGAQSHVAVSFEMPEYTSDSVAVGNLRMLEAIRWADCPVKFYQAGSSEMYGKVREVPQRETTPFYPRSPYAVSKVFAHHMTVQYREAHGIFACNGILFNHESPRRGVTFVTRKVTRGVARILSGQAEKLYMGNLDAKRDWGYAKEYVGAMWTMLQQEQPDDYVIATGEMHSVRELVERAFALVGLDWQDYIAVDERYMRPTEVDELLGDASKAERTMGWTPKVRFHELVAIMLAHDLREHGVDLAPYPELANIPPDLPTYAEIAALVAENAASR